jgi:ERCC4-type nuclease
MSARKGASPLPTVIIDTREQLPYSFPAEEFHSKRVMLPQGDYSLEGFEHLVSVERKNPDDWVASIIQDRFWAELKRFEGYERVAVVIECSRPDITARKYRANVDPRAVFGAEAAIVADYGIAVIWAGDRPHAVDFTRRFLSRFYLNKTR